MATYDRTKVDDAAFTPGTDDVYPIGAMADESSPDSVDEGDVGIPRMTLDRKLLTRVVGSTDANRLEVSAAGAAAENLTQVAGNSVTAGAGSVAAGTQRVTLASDDPAVASLGIIDDWDESDRAKVNPIAGQAGVQGGSGTTNALTQRVVLATDVALPTGTNSIGKISDITTSVTPGTAAGNLGKAEDAVHSSGDTGVMALGVSTDGLSDLVDSLGDYTPIATSKGGVVGVGGYDSANGFIYPIPISDSTDPNGPSVVVSPLGGSVFTVGGTINLYNDLRSLLAQVATVASSNYSLVSPCRHFSLQVIATLAATWDVRLEVSLDGTNFSQVIQHTNADLTGTVKGNPTTIPAIPTFIWRLRVAGISGAGASLDIYGIALT